MPNEFVARNGVIALNNSIVTGSLTVTNGITGSLFGTSSWAINALTSSFVPGYISGNGTTNYVSKFTAAGIIGPSQIFDNGTRVGIGTASPAAKVDIRGSGLQDLYFISTTATNVENTIQSYFNNGGAWADLSTKSQNLILNTGPSGGPQSERLRITSDGDILHRGTYNPLSAANRGNIMLNGSASNIIGFSNNSALRGYIFHTDSDFQFYNNTTGGRVGLYTEGTARLWIQSNGRIGVNTTTDAGYQFDINGTLRSVNGANFATTSGNVGIGTESPNGKLDVNGNTIISGSLTVITGSAIELQILNTGVRIGNVVTDTHTVTGSLNVSGSITGSLFGTASFAVSASWAPGGGGSSTVQEPIPAGAKLYLFYNY
jgi:hypothetical protein